MQLKRQAKMPEVQSRGGTDMTKKLYKCRRDNKPDFCMLRTEEQTTKERSKDMHVKQQDKMREIQFMGGTNMTTENPKAADYYTINLKMDSDIHGLGGHEDYFALFDCFKFEATLLGTDNPFEGLPNLLPSLHKTFPNFYLIDAKSKDGKISLTYEAGAMDPYYSVGEFFSDEFATKHEVLLQLIQENQLTNVEIETYLSHTY
ncbi:hypothetical protein [Sporosarcina sp. FSL K6-5500]|uniref:hypothetical protein n=1 Tax=Sporosarcina sp. FSL K6-5500 TaxID=2921558 RepID=UPI0030FB28EA